MENKNCNSCNSCDYCDYCDSCNYCNSCDYCNFCYSCNYCDSCNSCNFCNFCFSCINLKMTEYNYFCYAEDREKDWYQQSKYRVFNTQLTEEEYDKIQKINIELKFNKNDSYETKYQIAFNNAFNKLSQTDKESITSLPWFNKDIFKKYWWIELNSDIIEVKWIKYKRI